jgi:hypothetical protein
MPVQTTAESVNVHECSWADIECTLLIPNGPSITIEDVEGWKWASKLEVGESRGVSGGRPRKRTRGSASHEASATATRGGWMALGEAIETAAIALGQQRGDQVIIGGVAFDVLLQHSPLGDTRIYSVKLVGCRLLGDSSDMKQGSEADMVELTLNPLNIMRKSKSGNWLVLA